jgi:hypothetical protein
LLTILVGLVGVSALREEEPIPIESFLIKACTVSERSLLAILVGLVGVQEEIAERSLLIILLGLVGVQEAEDDSILLLRGGGGLVDNIPSPLDVRQSPAELLRREATFTRRTVLGFDSPLTRCLLSRLSREDADSELDKESFPLGGERCPVTLVDEGAVSPYPSYSAASSKAGVDDSAVSPLSRDDVDAPAIVLDEPHCAESDTVLPSVDVWDGGRGEKLIKLLSESLLLERSIEGLESGAFLAANR